MLNPFLLFALPRKVGRRLLSLSVVVSIAISASTSRADDLAWTVIAAQYFGAGGLLIYSGEGAQAGGVSIDSTISYTTVGVGVLLEEPDDSARDRIAMSGASLSLNVGYGHSFGLSGTLFGGQLNEDLGDIPATISDYATFLRFEGQFIRGSVHPVWGLEGGVDVRTISGLSSDLSTTDVGGLFGISLGVRWEVTRVLDLGLILTDRIAIFDDDPHDVSVYLMGGLSGGLRW